MVLSKDQVMLLERAVGAVWQQIAPDVLATSPRISNVSAVEACIDADRLTFNCGYGRRGKADGEAAQVLVRQMIADAGYGPTLRYLARHVKLGR